MSGPKNEQSVFQPLPPNKDFARFFSNSRSFKELRHNILSPFFDGLNYG